MESTAHLNIHPGDLYQHYKGGLYEIICAAINEADLSPIVVYRPLQGNTVQAWSRPLTVFFEVIEVQGQHVQRFVKVDPGTVTV